MELVEKSTVCEKINNPEKMLENIIVEEAIYPVYQPIVSLCDGTILGYEGLTGLREKNIFLI